MANAGSVSLELKLDKDAFTRQLARTARETQATAKASGAGYGRNFTQATNLGQGIDKGLRLAMPKVEQQGRTQGAKYSDAFGKTKMAFKDLKWQAQMFETAKLYVMSELPKDNPEAEIEKRIQDKVLAYRDNFELFKWDYNRTPLAREKGQIETRKHSELEIRTFKLIRLAVDMMVVRITNKKFYLVSAKDVFDQLKEGEIDGTENFTIKNISYILEKGVKVNIFEKHKVSGKALYSLSKLFHQMFTLLYKGNITKAEDSNRAAFMAHLFLEKTMRISWLETCTPEELAEWQKSNADRIQLMMDTQWGVSEPDVRYKTYDDVMCEFF